MQQLTGDIQRTLLTLARETIAAKLDNQALPKLPTTNQLFQEKYGAFVTLHNDHNLRGCIGYIRGIYPLAQAIQNMALAAAFEDPRFYPLQKKELPHLSIEISILSPLEPITPENIVLGTHGLYIQQGNHSGLLLPQVATEQQWTKEEFLTGVCEKAGLSKNAWQLQDVLYGFTATIFNDEH